MTIKFKKISKAKKFIRFNKLKNAVILPFKKGFLVYT